MPSLQKDVALYFVVQQENKSVNLFTASHNGNSSYLCTPLTVYLPCMAVLCCHRVHPHCLHWNSNQSGQNLWHIIISAEKNFTTPTNFTWARRAKTPQLLCWSSFSPYYSEQYSKSQQSPHSLRFQPQTSTINTEYYF